MFVTIGARNFRVVPGVLREIAEDYPDLVRMTIMLCAEAVAQQSYAPAYYGPIFTGLDLSYQRLQTIEFLNGSVLEPLHVFVENSIYQGPSITPTLHSLRLLLTAWADRGISSANFPIESVVHANWLEESNKFFVTNQHRYARVSTLAQDFAELKLQADPTKVAQLISLLPLIS